ncbi:MAG: preprotein translocase subunit YajC [Clostridium sp.]|nr:preprotein translocase subunit YajC [Clostridium sp.]
MLINTILLQEAAQEGSMWNMIIMMVLIFGIMYFLMIRPQQKRQKKVQEERNKLEKGSKVVTQGGIIGKVREIKENSFVIEIADGVKITVLKEYVFAMPDVPENGAEKK